MSEQNKHTPGPWKQIPQHGAGPMIAREYETGKQMQPKGLRLVCHMLQRGDSLPQDEANARLIAAAPELLEALEPFARFACADPHVGEEDCHNCKARAAIAKAKGGGHE